MKARLAIVLLILAGGGLAALYILRTPDNEPRYRGKPLSKIIKEMNSGSADQQQTALVAIAHLGPEAKAAVPDLIRLLDDRQLAVRDLAIQALGNIGPDAAEAVPKLTAMLPQASEERFRKLSTAFQLMGPMAEPAVPAFITALADKRSDVRGEAGTFLKVMWPITLEPVKAALQHENPLIRARCCSVLAMMKLPEKEVVPVIEPLLQDEDEFVRKGAQEAIDKIREDPYRK